MTSGVGFFGASHLLLKLHTNLANEDDLRRLAECNYHDLRKPGEITKNVVLGIGEKLNNVSGSEGKRIFCDHDEQLRLAGFDDPFDADNINELVTILRPYIARYHSGTTTNKVLDETPRNTEETKLPESTSRVGILTAVNLLYELELGIISDYDLRQLVEYEKRLKIGNDRRAGVLSEVSRETTRVPVEDNQWPPPTLGTLTNNLLTELSAKLATTKDLASKDRTLEEFEYILQHAGFVNHYGSRKIEELMNELEDLRRAHGKTFNEESGEGASEMLGVDKKELLSEVSVDVPPDVSSQVAIKTCKIQKKIEKLEKQLKLAGFGEHCSTVQIQELRRELESLKITSKDMEVSLKASSEITETCTKAADNLNEEVPLNKSVKEMKPQENSKEVMDEKAIGVTENDASESANKRAGQVAVEIENKITVENSEEVAGAVGPCVANEDAAQIAREDTSEPTEREWLSKLAVPNLPKTGLSAAFHIVLKIQKGQASEAEIKKLRECEEKLILAEIGRDNVQATASEPLPALGTITFNLLRKFSAEMKIVPAGDLEAISKICTMYVSKLKFAGFDTISETEKMWNELENAFSVMYKATEASKAVSNEKEQSDVETSKVMTDEISNQVPDKEGSEVSGKVVNEKKSESIENEHGAEVVVENSNLVLDEEKDKSIEKNIKEVVCEETDMIGENASVVKGNTAVEKGQVVVERNAGCKANQNAGDEASTPCRPEDTSPKNPRDTHIKMNLQPGRKMVVARRRLKEQAPMDWFSTDDSKPPPDFDSSYTRLYSELPLSCRAYAFSTRLKGIKEKLKNVNEPLACLLRKEYSNVVEAFDRYLSTVQKRASMEPINSRWTRVQPNQEKWRHEIIFQLFMSLDNLPGGLRIRPLDFSQPLTIRASFVAERLKMVEVKLRKADAQQALLLSKEFCDIAASFATRWGRPLDCPIPGEPYDDRTSRPLPDELEHLRQDKNRAEREYKLFPSVVNKQVRDQLTNEFKRQLAIWKDSQV